ncbi:MAG: RluA family pseudouridine synthase [Myxococcota bacterium]
MAGDPSPDDDLLLPGDDFEDEADAGATAPGASGAAGPLVFSVDESGAGQRLDALLAGLAGVSRARVQRWIEQDRVRVAGAPARASRLLASGERIEAWPGEPVAMSLAPEPIPLVVLYEDRDLIVLDKPAGLVVHPAPGHPGGTLVNALLHHCRGELAGIGGVLRPGIVHRLDRGTSGVLVAAKTDLAHQGLAAQFARHSIDRIYRTFVRGLPRADAGEIDRPIGRHPEDRQRMSVRTRAGRPARTHWRVVARDRANAIAELEIRPETGRTHQIRVHLASAGLPVVGDVVYGRARGDDARLGRPALHAAHLGFVHPRTGESLGFDAPLPADLVELVASLRLEPAPVGLEEPGSRGQGGLDGERGPGARR